MVLSRHELFHIDRHLARLTDRADTAKFAELTALKEERVAFPAKLLENISYIGDYIDGDTTERNRLLRTASSKPRRPVTDG